MHREMLEATIVWICDWFMVCGLYGRQPVSLPEWSKGLRSGRNVFERVDSNPTADTTFRFHTRRVVISLVLRIWYPFRVRSSPRIAIVSQR